MPDKDRRFPLPWTIEGNYACYWIQDADGKKVAYVYFKETGWGQTTGDNTLTRIEALRIARNIVKLPDMIRRLQQGQDRLSPAKKGEGVEQDRCGDR